MLLLTMAPSIMDTTSDNSVLVRKVSFGERVIAANICPLQEVSFERNNRVNVMIL